MKIGYARISTEGQHLDLQISALNQAGCDKIFEDRASGAKASRPGLNAAMRTLRAGDTLVVWRFDRLARSVPHLAKVISNLQKRGIGFISITEAIDTNSEIGLMILYVLGAIAQFERSLIRERINAGLSAARARGSRLGRKPILSPEQRLEIQDLHMRRHADLNDIARKFGVHPRTIRRCLKASGAQLLVTQAEMHS